MIAKKLSVNFKELFSTMKRKKLAPEDFKEGESEQELTFSEELSIDLSEEIEEISVLKQIATPGRGRKVTHSLSFGSIKKVKLGKRLSANFTKFLGIKSKNQSLPVDIDINVGVPKEILCYQEIELFLKDCDDTLLEDDLSIIGIPRSVDLNSLKGFDSFYEEDLISQLTRSLSLNSLTSVKMVNIPKPKQISQLKQTLAEKIRLLFDLENDLDYNEDTLLPTKIEFETIRGHGRFYQETLSKTPLAR
jgi:hypothetical protein